MTELREPKSRIAFDLDETLGSAITDSYSLIDFNFRKGCFELLAELRSRYTLVLWTVSNRSYAQKVLKFGLAEYFQEVYSWDDISNDWKDIRQINVDYLIDDQAYHKDAATQYGLDSQYIIIPPYGSPEDEVEPMAWANSIRGILL